ncbi:MAG: outer membrane beta-barrel protein [Bryobacteraceae bacterium]
MRPLLFLLLLASAALAQPVSFGLKAGVPLTDSVNTVQGDTTAATGRYLFGPETEVRLPLGLSVEFDALYRHFSYTNYEASAGSSITTIGSSGNWEFPIVAKYRFRSKIVRPYVEAGVVWDALSGLKNTSIATPCSLPGGCENTDYPPTPSSQTTAGVVLGGGVDIHAFVIHVAPEFRFTRWAKQYFNLSGDLHSGHNQVEFLVGFTFR